MEECFKQFEFKEKCVMTAYVRRPMTVFNLLYNLAG